MKSLITIVIFILRHLLAVLLGILLGCVLWTIMYLALLAFAALTNEGLGGPFAYPAGVVLIVVGCGVIGWGVFAPSCALGVFACRVFEWRKLAAIPIVFVCGIVLSYLRYFVYMETVTASSMPSGWEMLKNFTLYLSIPLGIYWWITEGPGALIEVIRGRLARRNEAKSAGEIHH